MYIPAANRVEDRAALRSFLHTYNFATVVSTAPGGSLWASHLPLLLVEGEGGDRIFGHLARANEQWQHWAAHPEVLCLFQGPHAYVSPSWYAAKVAVPTWNYTAVHVYGRARIENDPAVLRKVLADTTAKHEAAQPKPWPLALPEEYFVAMMNATVGFSIEITRLEGKFKLSQNRSAEDQAGVWAALEGSPDPGSRALADFARAHSGVTPAR